MEITLHIHIHTDATGSVQVQSPQQAQRLALPELMSSLEEDAVKAKIIDIVENHISLKIGNTLTEIIGKAVRESELA